MHDINFNFYVFLHGLDGSNSLKAPGSSIEISHTSTIVVHH